MIPRPPSLHHAATGQFVTDAEWQVLWRRVQARAIEIFANPYAAPEKLEWAIEVYPEGMAEVIQDRGEIWKHGREERL